jgi:hypothetical protein
MHPTEKMKMHFEAALPQDFEKLLEKVRNYSAQL